MDQFNVYKDMKARTNGEIYIGVVGPVRTGKSTFIKRFMNLMVLPNIEDENLSGRIRKDTEEEYQTLFIQSVATEQINTHIKAQQVTTWILYPKFFIVTESIPTMRRH